MNQCEEVARYISEKGSITTREAFIELGVTRLSARIYELKDAGYTIVTDRVKVKNRYGETCVVTRYRFKGAEE
jgi:hypothetical protein